MTDITRSDVTTDLPACRPRLGAAIRGPFSGRPLIALYSAEEEAARLAMQRSMPHAALVPMLVAARAASARYDAWQSAWDDPVL